MSASALYQKTKHSGSGMGVADELGRTSEWMKVAPGGEKPFDFNTKGKIRHRVRKKIAIVCANNRCWATYITIQYYDRVAGIFG